MENWTNRIEPLTPEEIIARINQLVEQWSEEEKAEKESIAENQEKSNPG